MKAPQIGVIGCGTGAVVIAMAQEWPTAVLAGFDHDPGAVASARRAAAGAAVADRVTFEVAARGHLLGAGYDMIFLLPRARDLGFSRPRWPHGTCVGTSVPDP